MRRGKTFAARFAGERIALYRSAGGVVYALEDRCAHRQVPLSMGVVEGEALRCCYHAWAYRGDGRISQIPYLPKGTERPPRGVRAYPVREAYGLVFVFPGDPSKADGMPLPELPEFDSERHKTMTYSRTVDCHYSFMHENLLDMNHQFLHRGVVGRIHPELLDYETGLDWVQARYQFTHTAGKKSTGRRPAHHARPLGAARHHHPHRLPVPDAAAVGREPGRRRSRCGRPTCPRMRGSAPAMPSAC